MSLCIIPARGGSKRISDKNVKVFCGKPMIQWSIEAAQQSGCFDQILVSTDSDIIARVAVNAGASVPFVRPANLADDHTATQAVIQHAIQYVADEMADNYRVDLPVCCLYATAPFARSADIREAYELLENSGYVMPVTSFAFPVQRAARINSSNCLEMLHPEHFNTRSQDLEEIWHDAGQFYWASAESWLDERTLYVLKTIALPLPRWRVQDIDTPEDWQRAEALFTALGLHQTTASGITHHRRIA